MTATDIIANLEAKFGTAIVSKKLDGIDPFVVVDPSRLVEVAMYLRDEPTLNFEMLNSISGVDYLEIDPKKVAKAGFEPHLEVVYHVCSITLGHRFTFKVSLSRWKDDVVGQIPEVPSLVSVWPAADWHEREAYDLCGVKFLNHPDLRRILLAEDWEGHPLRKDYEFPLEYHDIRCR